MGWGFRKSVNFGPVRVNLSKSGIGYSVGGKHLRVGKNAKGQDYMTAGFGGIHYRKVMPKTPPPQQPVQYFQPVQLPPQPQPQPLPPYSPPRNMVFRLANNQPIQPPAQPAPVQQSTAPQPPSSSPPVNFSEAFNEAVALVKSGKKQEAYQKLTGLARDGHKDPNLFLWIAFTTPNLAEARRAITMVAKIDPANPNLASALVWLSEQEAKQPQPSAPLEEKPTPKETVESPATQTRPLIITKNGNNLIYQLSGQLEEAYGVLVAAFDNLVGSFKIWHVVSEMQQLDKRHNAGASSTIERTLIKLVRDRPPNMTSNIYAPIFPLGWRNIYFMPDKLVIYQGWNLLGAVDYQQVTVAVEKVRFIEEPYDAPQDGLIVGQNWRYMNNSGGPDMRFSNNTQLPVYLYDCLRFSFPGFNESIYISRPGIAEIFSDTVRIYTGFLKAFGL